MPNPLQKKRCCRNCHFFAMRYFASLQPALTSVRPLTPNERATLPSEKNRQWLTCAQEVWGIEKVGNEQLETIVDKARGEACFFRSVQEGMSFEAAKVLQERESQNRELKRSNRYTKTALAIATLGLIASVVSNCTGPDGISAGGAVEARQGRAGHEPCFFPQIT